MGEDLVCTEMSNLFKDIRGGTLKRGVVVIVSHQEGCYFLMGFQGIKTKLKKKNEKKQNEKPIKKQPIMSYGGASLTIRFTTFNRTISCVPYARNSYIGTHNQRA